jgi:hypothetical protein
MEVKAMTNRTGNNRRKAIGLVMFLGFLLILGLPFCVHATPVGKVTALEGNVDVTPPGGKAQTLKLNDPVNLGDILRTKSRSKVEVTFTDGNLLRLAESTRLKMTQYAPGENQKSYLNLFRGKTQSIVGALGKGSQYEIHTPTAICGVRGTNFFSFFINGVSGAVFKEGSGYGYNPNMPQDVKPIAAGQSMLVTQANLPPVVKPTTSIEMEKLLKDTAPPDDKGKKDEGAPKDTALTPSPPAPPPTQEPPPPLSLVMPPAATPPPVVQLTTIQVVQTPTDTSPPVVTVTSTPPTLTNTQNATFSYQANETSDFEYRLDGGPWQPAGSSTTTSSVTIPVASEGTHTFELKATDSSGNASSPATYSWTTDYTAPSFIVSGVPSGTTSQSSASINLTGEAGANYTYSLDSGSPTATGGTINLANLSNGTHKITVQGTDAAGNTTTISYEWTVNVQTETTPPVIAIAPQASPGTTSVLTNVNVSISSNETATYSYKLDSGSWMSTGSPLALSGLSEGSHSLEVKATDAEGNPSTQSVSFDLNRYSLTGNFYGSIANVYGTATGDVAGVSNKDWGGWKITMAGSGSYPPNPSWTMYAGGRSSDGTASNHNGYWVDIVNGTSSAGTLSGSSTFKYLSLDRWGTGTGSLTGTYIDAGDDIGSYSLTDSGNNYTETPLKFVSKFYADTNTLFYPNANGSRHDNGSLSGGTSGSPGGLMGGTESPWTVGQSVDVKFIGITSITDHNKANTLWSHITSYNTGSSTTYDGGAYQGYADAVVEEVANGIKGKILALYIDPAGKAGYLKGNYAGSVYPAISTDPYISMWEATGSITPTKKVDNIGVYAADMYNSISSGSLNLKLAGSFGAGSGSLSILPANTYGCTESIRNNTTPHVAEPWGIFHYAFTGLYSNPLTTTWSATAGGSASLGSYWNSGWYSDNGYWMLNIDNAKWDNAVWLGGGSERTGKFLTPRKMGTITADLYGKYNDPVEGSGTWLGFISGTWDGAPLSHVSSIDTTISGAGMKYYDGTWQSDGSLAGLVGGTASLWSATAGTPASLTAIGAYSAGANQRNVWGTSIRSYNYNTLTYTTYDGGAYSGYIRGIENSGSLEGQIVALYIDPSGNAGYLKLKDSMTGTSYSGVGMFEMTGSAYPVQMASASEVVWSAALQQSLRKRFKHCISIQQ